ncbi:NAD+ kinase [Thermosyntropha lipolytica DSM 11003]|uniref:NAD kinase n=1 Tax=Thermosyntropha lipolytica DSM 11003 TaxID=1123382 RepID=A0A1M5LK20_9FIRM|nr:NAD(+)/NADH kinase [Thermosyntropha lipolytica]SHG64713.1 NAD+ kinase [Thermosyntropha lipolytica DSM 11003]
MKILLVNNRFKENTEIMAQEVAKKLLSQGCRVEVDNGEALPQLEDVDIIMVLGGDGTILRAARQYARFKVPLLGVNMGTVGFLSHIKVEEIETCLEKFVRGDYTVDERMMLKALVYRDGTLYKELGALNEVVVRTKVPRLLSLPLYIEREKIADYKGDGVIIATPTGTTAYSLSAGGPVLEPEMEALVITPVSSYVLARRPLVVRGDRVLALKNTGNGEEILCADGQINVDLLPGDEIIVQKADYKLRLLNIKKPSFFHHFDERLGRV